MRRILTRDIPGYTYQRLFPGAAPRVQRRHDAARLSQCLSANLGHDWDR